MREISGGHEGNTKDIQQGNPREMTGSHLGVMKETYGGFMRNSRKTYGKYILVGPARIESNQLITCIPKPIMKKFLMIQIKNISAVLQVL